MSCIRIVRSRAKEDDASVFDRDACQFGVFKRYAIEYPHRAFVSHAFNHDGGSREESDPAHTSCSACLQNAINALPIM
jgi:hypothetical protein